MKYRTILTLLFMVSTAGVVPAADPAPVVDLGSPAILGAVKPSSEEVAASFSDDPARPGVVMTAIRGKEQYPGLALTPPDGGVFDLSAHGHVELTVTNIGDEALPVHLRVDNEWVPGTNPWSTESVYVKPGETKTVKVIFGYSHGRKPGFKLDPAKIVRMLVFTTKPHKERILRIESLVAAGPAGETPPVNPASVRVKPVDGFITGGPVALDVETQVVATEGVQFRSGETAGGLAFTFSGPRQVVKLGPPRGRWSLIDGHQVRVRLHNRGERPVRPSVRLESQKGNTDPSAPDAPIPPGEDAEIVVSFIPSTPWTGVKGSSAKDYHGTPGTGTRFESNAATRIAVISDLDAGEGQRLELVSATLEAPAVRPPDWVGARPPAEGEWTLTFEENFDGDQIDLSRWNIHTANFWDKRTHFSRDNVIVRDGKVRLRYEKKRGPHNDNPEGAVTDYASGFLDTYGKWVQRYGYFEARMKLPTAPGLWPAFWLMPDRGLEEGPQWKRADTGRGGMEFDIMEYLSGWGPHRYNVAFHWDGYGDAHKSTGTEQIYVAHDEEGFITTGLLWLPGYAAVYNNGRLVAEWETPRISNVPSDIMFTHVSGGWANVPLRDEELPDDFVIDYVRVWQRVDLASDLDGVKFSEPVPAAPGTPGM